MLKSDLPIEPYTIAEALVCINAELKSKGRHKIGSSHFNNLIYNIVKVERIKVKKKPVSIHYNSIVDIYNHINTKRYPKNRKTRCK
jgi:hypothetical protein